MEAPQASLASRPRRREHADVTYAWACRSVLTSVAIFALAAATASGGSPVAGSAACETLPVAGFGTVQAVLDGRTLLLDDGRTVRLSGIEPPASSGRAREAAAALQKIAAGKQVTLHATHLVKDRHERLVAHVALAAKGLEPSLQRDMLRLGLARVAARSDDDRACLAGGLSLERQARESGLGLWADPDDAIRRADDPMAVLAMRGRFALVEGRVISVRESGGTIYVNFGRRWTEDFTVTIGKRNERIFVAAGMPPKGLAGRQIRVRGVVEERGGPWIEAKAPAQIEILDRR